MSPARKLQNDIAAQSLIMVPGAPDALSARLVEKAGFAAVYMTGFGATASRLGTPDIGLLSQTEMTTHARDMARAVSIPIVAEVETVARRIEGPKVVSIVDGNETTALSADDLQELGFSIALYAVTTLFSAARTMSNVLATLKHSGRSEHDPGTMVSYDEFCDLVDLNFHRQLDDRFGA